MAPANAKLNLLFWLPDFIKTSPQKLRGALKHLNIKGMKKVLLVDDDRLLREALAKALSEHGYQVVEAGDGEQALNLATTNHPNLLMTDVVMPKLDGLGLVQKVRASEWGKELPIIVLTIKDTDINDVNKSLETGIVAYLSKSDISREQIISLVDQQLGGPQEQ